MIVPIFALLSPLLAACGSSSPVEINFPTGKFIYTVDGNVFTETSNYAGCKTNVDFTYTFEQKISPSIMSATLMMIWAVGDAGLT
jgi:hypothetical protein